MIKVRGHAVIRSAGILIATALFLCPVAAASDDPALALADYLFEARNFGPAAVEYKRYVYFNPDGDRASYAHYQIGLSYRELQEWPKAAEAMRHAVSTAGNDSIRDERRIDLAVILIVSGNSSGAELELVRVSHFSSFPKVKRRASFFLGVSCIYGYKWSEALSAYRRFTRLENPLSGSSRVTDSLLQAATELKYKSPRLAKTLSTFVPGSGQIYAGDWKNGFNAMAINAVTGYWFIDGLKNGTVADIITGYFLVFFRYYRGNRNNAYNLALKYNETVNHEQSQLILDHLYRTTTD